MEPRADGVVEVSKAYEKNVMRPGYGGRKKNTHVARSGTTGSRGWTGLGILTTHEEVTALYVVVATQYSLMKRNAAM